MGPTSPCVGRGGRCYGANALRSAAFGGCVFNFPANTNSHSRTSGRAVPPPLFHICGRCCGREFGGGGVHPGGLGRAAVELLCRGAAHTRPRGGVAKLLRRRPPRGPRGQLPRAQRPKCSRASADRGALSRRVAGHSRGGRRGVV